MGIEEDGAIKCFTAAGWSLAAKPCDSCKSAAALLFCRSDSAFLCMGCDTKLHRTNTLASRHERVWMCEVCEQAPASVTCKADAASLCVTCDRDIHSANPLARRHDRSPVVPFYDTAESVVKSTAAAAAFFLVPASNESNSVTVADQDGKMCTSVADEVPHTTSWILSNAITSKLPADTPDLKSNEFLCSDSVHFLDLDYPVPTSDSVVPVQTMKPLPLAQMIDQSPENHFEIDFTRSQLNSYSNNYTAQSLSQSVSSSSMDVGVVPDGSSMSDISYPFGLQMNTSLDLSGSTNGSQPLPLSGMEREVRVLRYREKRKNRKFEKTIRYASRKAYAETRPRIKGRFAKRTETEAEVDCWLTSGGSTTSFLKMGDARYGVVPSF